MERRCDGVDRLTGKFDALASSELTPMKSSNQPSAPSVRMCQRLKQAEDIAGWLALRLQCWRMKMSNLKCFTFNMEDEGKEDACLPCISAKTMFFVF
jgi:hypothetical protein